MFQFSSANPPPNATISSTASCAGRSMWPLSGISDRHVQLPLGLGTLEPDSGPLHVFLTQEFIQMSLEKLTEG